LLFISRSCHLSDAYSFIFSLRNNGILIRFICLGLYPSYPSCSSLTSLPRCAEDFNGAQLKAVCVEAGMLALRRGATELNHEDFMEGINQVKAKKKSSLLYYV
jgi:hypothetical protein